MNRTDRAKQFIPFDALKGFREAILEKEKIIVPKRELSEDLKEELDRIFAQISIGDIITVTFYNGEQYETITGSISNISSINKSLKIDDTRIPFNDISAIDIQ